MPRDLPASPPDKTDKTLEHLPTIMVDDDDEQTSVGDDKPLSFGDDEDDRTEVSPPPTKR